MAFSQPKIIVKDPWVREVPPVSKMSAGFLTIINTGTVADRLLGVSCDASESAEIHSMTQDNGIMRMRKVDSLKIEPGKKVELRPGGLHIMLINLKRPLKEGDKVKITLTFEKSGAITVKATVRSMK